MFSYLVPINFDIYLHVIIPRLFELNSKVLLHFFILVWYRLFFFWLKVTEGFEI